MTLDDLSTQYSRLKADLAHAYVAPVWDSGHIDRLTDQIADIESALAVRGNSTTFHPAAKPGFGTSMASAC